MNTLPNFAPNKHWVGTCTVESLERADGPIAKHHEVTGPGPVNGLVWVKRTAYSISYSVSSIGYCIDWLNGGCGFYPSANVRNFTPTSDQTPHSDALSNETRRPRNMEEFKPTFAGETP